MNLCNKPLITRVSLAPFDFGYQHLYSVFKNQKLKLSSYIGLIYKQQTLNKYRYNYFYQKDSISNGSRSVIRDESLSFSHSYKFKAFDRPRYFLSFSPGILYYPKKNVQHQLGINISFQLNEPQILISSSKRYFFRLFYSFYF
jgi:hypothetical protein